MFASQTWCILTSSEWDPVRSGNPLLPNQAFTKHQIASHVMWITFWKVAESQGVSWKRACRLDRHQKLSKGQIKLQYSVATLPPQQRLKTEYLVRSRGIRRTLILQFHIPSPKRCAFKQEYSINNSIACHTRGLKWDILALTIVDLESNPEVPSTPTSNDDNPIYCSHFSHDMPHHRWMEIK